VVGPVCVEVRRIAMKKSPLRRGLDGCGTTHHEVRLWLAPVCLFLGRVYVKLGPVPLILGRVCL